MAVAVLTSEQSRMIRDYIPALSSGHPPSFDLAAKLDEVIALLNSSEGGLASIVSGAASVLSGATTVVVAVGLAFDGSPATATISGVTTNPCSVVSAIWDGAGNLTITVSADPGASNAAVSYSVDGRS